MVHVRNQADGNYSADKKFFFDIKNPSPTSKKKFAVKPYP
jgi:hypothetical protein